MCFIYSGGNVIYLRAFAFSLPLHCRFMSHEDIDAVAACRGGARRHTAATADNSSASPTAATTRAPTVSLQTMAAAQRQQQQPSAVDAVAPLVLHYSSLLAPLQFLCDASSSSLQHAASRDFQSIDDILLHQVQTHFAIFSARYFCLPRAPLSVILIVQRAGGSNCCAPRKCFPCFICCSKCFDISV